MKVEQWTIRLAPRARGFHIITQDIAREVGDFGGISTGVCHIIIQHTSASLTLNENADPDVRTDFEQIVRRLVPENEPYYVHTLEGPDDMPAHVKASLLGSSVTVPISGGRLNLGTWQGVYLGEHRNHAGGRRLVVTAFGA